MTSPTLVYDDDCGFCTWCAERVADEERLRIVGFGDLSPRLRERLPRDYADCVHLVADDGVYSCGAAVEQALVRTKLPTARPLVDFLRLFEDYERHRERAYRWVADRRDVWGRVLSTGDRT